MSDNYENREIRFINANYEDLFKIPNGGYITITLNNGEQLIRQCRFHGECHVEVGNNLYHICEFAEKMERAGNTYEPCSEPQKVAGYVITDRMPAREKVFVMGHNPNAVQPWVTWQSYPDNPSNFDWGHYWNNRSDAWGDLFRRADAERTGKVYDHTKFIKQKQNRDNGER